MSYSNSTSTYYCMYHVSVLPPPLPSTDCVANRCQVTPPLELGGVIGAGARGCQAVLWDIFSHLQMIGWAHVHVRKMKPNFEHI